MVDQGNELILGILFFSVVMSFYAVSVLLAGRIASNRRRRRRKWMSLAGLFGPLAVIALVLLPRR